MAIELICQGCARKLRVSEEHAGKQARCPECGAVTPVSAAAAEHSRAEPRPTEPSPSPIASPSNTPSAAPSAAPSSGPAAATARWMLRTDAGQTYGPISRAELESWVQQGRISPSAWLAYEGATEWQRADALFPSLNPRAGSSTGNPWAERPAWVAGGTASAGGVYGQTNWPTNALKQPHRGVVILVLGILGWLFCFLFGVVAFALGQADVRAMRRGEMDEAGMGMTQAGMYLGLANVILSLLFLAFVVVMGILGDM